MGGVNFIYGSVWLPEGALCTVPDSKVVASTAPGITVSGLEAHRCHLASRVALEVTLLHVPPSSYI